MISIKFTTIFGASLGFEITTKEEFELIDFPADWSFMMNLLFFRVTFIKYQDEEE